MAIEPKFLGYKTTWPVPGSDRTVLVPVRATKDDLVPVKPEEVSSADTSVDTLLKQSAPAASALLKTLTPQYVRDENKVILYAVLQSDNPLTASTVLAPDFGERFAETLGPDLLVAIPTRNRIFVFSRQAPEFQGMTDLVVAEYQSSPHPVSREIFTLRNGKLIAVGRYR